MMQKFWTAFDELALIAASTSLAVSLNLGMHDTHVAGERIVARECLLLATQRASNFLLAVVVNSVLVAR
jgi:hypothetical protein